MLRGARCVFVLVALAGCSSGSTPEASDAATGDARSELLELPLLERRGSEEHFDRTLVGMEYRSPRQLLVRVEADGEVVEQSFELPGDGSDGERRSVRTIDLGGGATLDVRWGEGDREVSIRDLHGIGHPELSAEPFHRTPTMAHLGAPVVRGRDPLEIAAKLVEFLWEEPIVVGEPPNGTLVLALPPLERLRRFRDESDRTYKGQCGQMAELWEDLAVAHGLRGVRRVNVRKVGPLDETSFVRVVGNGHMLSEFQAEGRVIVVDPLFGYVDGRRVTDAAFPLPADYDDYFRVYLRSELRRRFPPGYDESNASEIPSFVRF